jgi:hypothetical protein
MDDDDAGTTEKTKKASNANVRRRAVLCTTGLIRHIHSRDYSVSVATMYQGSRPSACKDVCCCFESYSSYHKNFVTSKKQQQQQQESAPFDSTILFKANCRLVLARAISTFFQVVIKMNNHPRSINTCALAHYGRKTLLFCLWTHPARACLLAYCPS